ncbi:uncharacterized protein LOC130448553 [Diorhabda sublineata]|uniref:uncharacterized protein LOC130448553 n=1 Tax=Diorhabda sublineata TaxID=1163346 RepID=UPI0024E1371B|nr:uncharacterized protein LOC130448553 [Diorhabda sublineata]
MRAWNSRSVKKEEKELVEKIKSHKIDILGITETKTKKKDEADSKRILDVLITLIIKVRIKSAWNRVRNTDVKEQCGIQDIVIWGRQRKRQWYNHVRRMDENRLPRIVLENNPPGSRPPGRPPKRWKYSWQSTSQEKMQRQLQN